MDGAASARMERRCGAPTMATSGARACGNQAVQADPLDGAPGRIEQGEPNIVHNPAGGEAPAVGLDAAADRAFEQRQQRRRRKAIEPWPLADGPPADSQRLQEPVPGLSQDVPKDSPRVRLLFWPCRPGSEPDRGHPGVGRPQVRADRTGYRAQPPPRRRPEREGPTGAKVDRLPVVAIRAVPQIPAGEERPSQIPADT